MKEVAMAPRFLLWFKRLFVSPDLHKDLLKYSLFKELNAHQRKIVASFLHEREFKAGESIFEANYPLEVIYFIESGEMELTPILAADGNTVLKKHQFVGVLDLFSEKKRLNSANARTDLKLRALSEKDFQELIAKDPALGVKLLKACCCFLSDFIAEHSRQNRS